MNPPNTKQCLKCQQDYPISDFYKAKGTKTGLSPYCKTCTKQLNSENTQKRRAFARIENGGATPRRRICISCNRNLPARPAYFNPTPYGPKGLSSTCKVCTSSAPQPNPAPSGLQELGPNPPYRGSRKKEKLTKLLLPPDTSSPIPDDPEVRAELEAFVKAHEQWK